MHCVKLLSKNITRIDVNSETNIGLWSACVTGSESMCATEKVIKGGEKGVCLCKKKKEEGGKQSGLQWIVWMFDSSGLQWMWKANTSKRR